MDGARWFILFPIPLVPIPLLLFPVFLSLVPAPCFVYFLDCAEWPFLGWLHAVFAGGFGLAAACFQGVVLGFNYSGLVDDQGAKLG